ncbi:amidohydrolase family protein [Candidimonas humi]|uniref:Amidohydrolase family protein n=1 Tax=Candidimonas humi TaxID=683355 RepID=A0ABV8P3V0_9BURK|nr:amidohydrolase family protein [Candidimonas humi]MBV6306918.1 amidohydrolase family protein [Candidimonas humi]
MATSNSPHIPIRADWLATRCEDILWPELPIIDPHHHLWDRPGSRYLLDELNADISSGHKVEATVFVQSRSMYKQAGEERYKPVGEVEFANGVAACFASGLYGPRRGCAGIVACADLTLGAEVDAVIERLLPAGGGRLRGIRNSTAWHAHPEVRSNPIQPPAGLLADPRFQAGAKRLSRHGLSLDVWAYHTQLPEVLELAWACPDVSIIVDHIGGPLGVGPYADMRDEVFQDWKSGMRDLSALPNVSVKLGGMGMKISGHRHHELDVAPSSDALAADWRPYIETLIDLYGTRRCMFESNFPVDKGMYSYHVLWNAFKKICRGCSPQEIADLFHDTAQRTYAVDIS